MVPKILKSRESWKKPPGAKTQTVIKHYILLLMEIPYQYIHTAKMPAIKVAFIEIHQSEDKRS